MFPASVRGDPRGKMFSSRGRGWGAIPDREFPVAIPTHAHAHGDEWSDLNERVQI
jgi:hypothetical protein